MRLFRILLGLSFLAIGSISRADDGMWMPQQIPMLADELEELGLQLDADSFADLTGFPMGAIVSLGGCSAAFVSDEGLIITNHHCVFGALQYNSTPEFDLIANGFLATTRTDELQANPTARVYVTTSIEDVTGEITGNLPAGISDFERAKLFEKRRKAMVKDCEQQEDVRCQVAVFFAGEQFLKLTQMKIKDVRLVYAPALGIGNFGDEEDNWMWPRHAGDFGFYRAYVGADGKPADYAAENVPYHPQHHLKISQRDLDPEDLILLAGYPGRTSRLVSADEVREAQEFSMPTSVRYREMLLETLHERGVDDRGVQIKNATRIASLENYLKKYTGTLQAFERDGLLDQKLANEEQLAGYFAGDAKRQAEYEAIHRELGDILDAQRSTRERDMLYRWLYQASPMLAQANLLYRNSVERAKSDDEREEGYQERDWPRHESGLRRTQRTIEPGTDRAGLRDFLLETQELPADQRIVAVDRALASTRREEPEMQIDALLDDLYGNTRMDDLETRLAMFAESTQEQQARDDAMWRFAMTLRPLGEEIEERDRVIEGANLRLRPRLIAAMREMKDGRLAPDANGTLRVGFGVVRGYAPRDGVYYQPQTTIEGVLEKDTGNRPFDSPAELLQLARGRNFGPYADPDLGTLAVGFISTVNVTNGSSGSSALNAWGEIAGLAFDMNWEGVAADWVVNERYVRTINVDSRYILWVMDAVDGAHHLLQEMGLAGHFGAAASRGK